MTGRTFSDLVVEVADAWEDAQQRKFELELWCKHQDDLDDPTGRKRDAVAFGLLFLFFGLPLILAFAQWMGWIGG